MNDDSAHEPLHEAGRAPSRHPADEGEAAAARSASRRTFLLGSLALGAGALLPGCSNTGQSARALPGPAWPSGGADPITPVARGPEPRPTTGHVHLPPGVIRRNQWAGGQPMPTLMQPMLPVSSITIHHCAGTVFTANDRAGTASRLEKIRQYHRGTQGWGDIGYHFAVDRSGTVWECRPLQWQGAHVGGHNEGNIGIVALGHFDEQRPTDAPTPGAAPSRHDTAARLPPVGRTGEDPPGVVGDGMPGPQPPALDGRPALPRRLRLSAFAPGAVAILDRTARVRAVAPERVSTRRVVRSARS